MSTHIQKLVSENKDLKKQIELANKNCKDMQKIQKAYDEQKQINLTQQVEQNKINEKYNNLQSEFNSLVTDIKKLRAENTALQKQLELTQKAQKAQNAQQNVIEINVKKYNENSALKHELYNLETNISDNQNAVATITYNNASVDWNIKDNRHTRSFISLQQFISNRFKIYFFSLKYADKSETEVKITDDNSLRVAFKYVSEQYEISDDNYKLKITVCEYDQKDLPLIHFTVQDICHTLKHWVYNDIKYQTNALKIQKIFTSRKLS
eukprot:376132_1